MQSLSLGSLRARLLPLLAVMGGVASIQVGAAMAKTLFARLGAPGVSTLRLGFAALIITLVVRPWRRPVGRRDLGAMAGYGVSLGVMNLSFYLALARLPLGVAVGLEFLGPLALSLSGSRGVREISLALAAGVGALLMPDWKASAAGLSLTPETLIGAFFAILSGACWAAYIVLGKRAGRAGSGVALSIGALVAFAVAAPVGFISAGSALFSPDVLVLGAGVAILSSVAPYSLDMYALKHLDSRLFSLLTALEPASAALAGYLLLGEKLSPAQIFAMGLIGLVSALALQGGSQGAIEPG